VGPYETPYVGPREWLAAYDPKREIGDVAVAPGSTCPTHPWWWLVAAAAAGGLVGFATAKPKKRRRGRAG
jgi:ABC-type branched-subunit amino acid transport system permease subunit